MQTSPFESARKDSTAGCDLSGSTCGRFVVRGRGDGGWAKNSIRWRTRTSCRNKEKRSKYSLQPMQSDETHRSDEDVLRERECERDSRDDSDEREAEWLRSLVMSGMTRSAHGID